MLKIRIILIPYDDEISKQLTITRRKLHKYTWSLQKFNFQKIVILDKLSAVMQIPVSCKCSLYHTDGFHSILLWNLTELYLKCSVHCFTIIASADNYAVYFLWASNALDIHMKQCFIMHFIMIMKLYHVHVAPVKNKLRISVCRLLFILAECGYTKRNI